MCAVAKQKHENRWRTPKWINKYMRKDINMCENKNANICKYS